MHTVRAVVARLPITGVQTAITLYTLVMATLMITGGIAIVAALALLFSAGVPTRQPGSAAPDAERGPPARDPAVV